MGVGSSDLQAELPRAVFPEQTAIPNVAPHDLNGPVPVWFLIDRSDAPAVAAAEALESSRPLRGAIAAWRRADRRHCDRNLNEGVAVFIPDDDPTDVSFVDQGLDLNRP